MHFLKNELPLSVERRFGWQRRRSGQRSKLELCQKGWSSPSFSPTLVWKTKKLHLFGIGLRKTLFYLKDHPAFIAAPGVRQLRKFGITLGHRSVCRRRGRRCHRSIHEAQVQNRFGVPASSTAPEKQKRKLPVCPGTSDRIPIIIALPNNLSEYWTDIAIGLQLSE